MAIAKKLQLRFAAKSFFECGEHATLQCFLKMDKIYTACKNKNIENIALTTFQ